MNANKRKHVNITQLVKTQLTVRVLKLMIQDLKVVNVVRIVQDASYDLTECRATKICIGNNNPEGCTPACLNGEFPETTNCLCRTDDTQCIAGICKSENHPDGCTCPSAAEQLEGIPKGQCGCLPSGDTRQECNVNILACQSDTVPPEGCICTGNYHPDSCRCPSEVDDLYGIPKDQCSCLTNEEDKREDCKVKKEGGLSAGAIAGIIVAIVVVVLGAFGAVIGYFAYKV
ncbi:MAG: hypothetical protein EZS28_020039 [Streblomastix strix]|uniref:Uncharacterized protein n=1 Tax=Streblomastix strix TaxID=222440 RepID=A0A5J4VPG1_9EUKA|nr:MAG: hypothetical protein EZS28_020039 [Streblomastix strix]